MSLIVNSKNTVADNNGLNLSLNKQSAKSEKMAAASATASSKCSKSNGHSIDAILGIRAAAAAQAAHQANLANNHHLFTNNSIHHSTGKIILIIGRCRFLQKLSFIEMKSCDVDFFLF